MPGQNKYPPIRLRTPIADQLSEPIGQRANALLARWLWLTSSALPEFSEAEWSLMRDACNGWASTVEPPELVAQGLEIQVHDAIVDERLDSKWGVDADEILSRLDALSPVETLAVVGEIEGWWAEQ